MSETKKRALLPDYRIAGVVHLVAIVLLSACSSGETRQQTQGTASPQDATQIQLDQLLQFSVPAGSNVDQ